MDNNQFKYVLIIGGAGNLGKALTKQFKLGNTVWKVHNVDFFANEESDKNIVLNKQEKLYGETHLKAIYQVAEKIKYDAILSVAGAFEGGLINNINIFEQSEKMLSANYFSSLLGNLINYVQLGILLLNFCNRNLYYCSPVLLKFSKNLLQKCLHIM